jgi:hypothetical protein
MDKMIAGRATTTSNLLLRVAIAFAFLYPPFDAISHADAWVGFFPNFLLEHFPGNTLLIVWGVVQAAIGLWILSGKRIFIPSVLAVLSLCAIVIFNLAEMEVVFRDISLALVAAALAWQSYDTTRRDAINP